MSAVRIFTPENRLADIIGGPGDPTADELEAKALDRLASILPDLQATILDRLAAIERITRQSEEIIFADSLALGDAALSICEIAGAANLAPLGEAARGIASMIDALVGLGVWHTDALKLHIDSLAMFAAHPDLPTAEVDRVLARLKAMRDGIGVPE